MNRWDKGSALMRLAMDCAGLGAAMVFIRAAPESPASYVFGVAALAEARSGIEQMAEAYPSPAKMTKAQKAIALGLICMGTYNIGAKPESLMGYTSLLLGTALMLHEQYGTEKANEVLQQDMFNTSSG
jgi:hypothetical protein